MKLAKRILIFALSLCMTVGIAVFAAACDDGEIVPESYAVTYALGSCDDTPYAGSSELPTESEKTAGEKFTLAEAIVWEGYTFLGWNDGADTYNAGAQYTMPASAVTLTATWEKFKGEENKPEPKPEPEIYTVTYSFGAYNGTRYAGSSELPTESDKLEGAHFNLAAAPVWKGYTFRGWYDGMNYYPAGAGYTMPAKNVTLSASWKIYSPDDDEPEPEYYAITYSLGSCNGTSYAGTSSLPTGSELTAGTQFFLPEEPVWEGYIFLGWNDGSDTYFAGALYTMPETEVTFTAIWEADTENPVPKYSVTYSFGGYEDIPYNGSSPMPSEADKAAGARFYLADAPDWGNFVFVGWFDGTNTYAARTLYTMPATSITLTATWKIPFMVSYSLGSCNGTNYGGSNATPVESPKAEGAQFRLADAPIWNGYIFNGWSDGTDIYAPGTLFTMPKHHVTFVALWEKDTSLTLEDILGHWKGSVVSGGSTSRLEIIIAENALHFFYDEIGTGWVQDVPYTYARREVYFTVNGVSYTIEFDEDTVQLYMTEEETTPVALTALTPLRFELPTQFVGTWVGDKYELTLTTSGIASYYCSDMPEDFYPVDLSFDGSKISCKLRNGTTPAQIAFDSTNRYLIITFSGAYQDTLENHLEIPEGFWGSWYGDDYEVTFSENGIESYSDKTFAGDSPTAIVVVDELIYCIIWKGEMNAYFAVLDDETIAIYSEADGERLALLRRFHNIPEGFRGTWYGEGYEVTFSERGIESYSDSNFSADLPTKISVSGNRIYCTLSNGTASYFIVSGNTVELRNAGTGELMATLMPSLGVPEGFYGTWYGKTYELMITKNGIEFYSNYNVPADKPVNVRLDSDKLYLTIGIGECYIVIINKSTLELHLNSGTLEATLTKETTDTEESFYGHWVSENFEVVLSFGKLDFFDGVTAKMWAKNLAYQFKGGKISFTDGLNYYTLELDDETVKLYRGTASAEELHIDTLAIPEGFWGHWVGGDYEIVITDTGFDLYLDPMGSDELPALVKLMGTNVLYFIVGGKEATITLRDRSLVLFYTSTNESINLTEGAAVSEDQFYGHWIGEKYEIIFSGDGLDVFDGVTAKVWAIGIHRVLNDGRLEFTVHGVSLSLRLNGNTLTVFENTSIVDTLYEYTLAIPEGFWGHWMGGGYELSISDYGFDAYSDLTDSDELPGLIKLTGDTLTFSVNGYTAMLTLQGNTLVLSGSNVSGNVTLSKVIEATEKDFYGHWIGDVYEIIFSEDDLNFFDGDEAFVWTMNATRNYADGVITLMVDNTYILRLVNGAINLYHGDELIDTLLAFNLALEDLYGCWTGDGYDITISESGIDAYGDPAQSEEFPALLRVSGNRLSFVFSSNKSGYIELKSGSLTLVIIDQIDGNSEATLAVKGSLKEHFYGRWIGDEYELLISENTLNFFDGRTVAWVKNISYSFENGTVSFSNGQKSYTLELEGNTATLREGAGLITLKADTLSVPTELRGRWLGEGYDITISETGFDAYTDSTQSGEFPALVHLTDNNTLTFTLARGKTAVVEFKNGSIILTVTTSDSSRKHTLNKPAPAQFEDYYGHWVGDRFEIFVSENKVNVFFLNGDNPRYSENVRYTFNTDEGTLTFTHLGIDYYLLLNGSTVEVYNVSKNELMDTLSLFAVEIPDTFYGRWIGSVYTVIISENGFEYYTNKSSVAVEFPVMVSMEDGKLYFYVYGDYRGTGIRMYLALEGGHLKYYSSENSAKALDILEKAAPIAQDDFYGHWVGNNYELIFSETGMHFYSGSANSWTRNIYFVFGETTGNITFTLEVNAYNLFYRLELYGDGIRVYENNGLMDTLEKYALTIPSQFVGHWTGGGYDITISESGITAYSAPDGVGTPAFVKIEDGKLTFVVDGDEVVIELDEDGSLLLTVNYGGGYTLDKESE